MRLYSAFIRALSEKFANFVSKSIGLNMNIANIIRFSILGILWLLLVLYILTHARITPYTVFAIVASAIIIFVPVYKNYVKNNQ